MQSHFTLTVSIYNQGLKCIFISKNNINDEHSNDEAPASERKLFYVSLTIENEL